MKAEWSAMLSGIGYYKLSERRRKQLVTTLLISLGLHLVGLAIFGGVVVMQSMRDEQVVFVSPPPLKTYEPRQLEHRVKVEQRQRSSSRPAMTPRLVAATPSDFALPEITRDPKVVQTSFQPRFRAVSGAGLGMGLGTGYGLGGFGLGVSAFDFFGIRGRGDRIAILMCVAISMAEESVERGVTPTGVAQFASVKARVAQVINAFTPNVMFNVIVFAETASQWSDEIQVATEANKRSAAAYIEPFNTRASWDRVGHRSGISSLDYGLGSQAVGGTTRFDLALSLAFKSGADTLLIISDGDVWTVRAHTPEELQAHADAMERWRQQTAAASERRDSGRRPVRTERVWVEGQPAQTDVIRERGGRRASGPTEGRWEERTVGGGGPRLPPRPQLPEQVWNMADYQNHINKLHEEFLAPQGRSMPTMHIIGFRSGREDSEFLRRLARAYDGQFRRVSSMR